MGQSRINALRSVCQYLTLMKSLNLNPMMNCLNLVLSVLNSGVLWKELVREPQRRRRALRLRAWMAEPLPQNVGGDVMDPLPLLWLCQEVGLVDYHR